MANTVTGPTTQFDGARKLINSIHVRCDGGNASTPTMVDVSSLATNSSNAACSNVALNKIWYSAAGTATNAATFVWDASSDVPFYNMLYDDSQDFSTIGGLQNTKASGYTGDVILEIPATSDAGDEYSIWCEWIKYYS